LSDSSTLVIIDQHAASERVAFERLRQQYRNAAVESQRLLFPGNSGAFLREVAVAARFRKELVAIGFECEPFGGTTLLVSSVPRLPHNASVSALIRDILHDLQQLGASGGVCDVEDALFARIACHSVVRGFIRWMQQIRELLRSMDNTGFAASCPHGRPVSHAVTLQELEKIFKRI
jgi:DNA mismatch repair protein MutL